MGEWNLPREVSGDERRALRENILKAIPRAQLLLRVRKPLHPVPLRDSTGILNKLRYT